MLDLSAAKVVQKSWGQQVWLDDYNLLLVMRAGGQTSMHKHKHHSHELQPLSGKAELQVSSERILLAYDPVMVDSGELHQITAIEDCVIYEQYIPDSMLPEDDIERLEC